MEEYRNFFFKVVGERVFVYNYQMNHVATYAAKDDVTVCQRIDDLIKYQDNLVDKIIDQLFVGDLINTQQQTSNGWTHRRRKLK